MALLFKVLTTLNDLILSQNNLILYRVTTKIYERIQDMYISNKLATYN